jgi:predicted CoA-binding protein
MKTGRIITADADIQAILKSARTIAIIGVSPKPDRDSYKVAHLKDHGTGGLIRLARAEILGEKHC